MPDPNFLKKLSQRVNDLERNLTQLRNSVNGRNNLTNSSDPRFTKVQLAESVNDRYTVLKLVHNPTTNSFPRAIIYGGSHPDDDLENFVTGIAQSPGAAGEHIIVQVEGVGFAKTIASTDLYGADDQIKVGNALRVDSSPGCLETGNSSSFNIFSAMESQHPSEQIIQVRFAVPPSVGGEQNRLFIVSVTSLFGGQTYFGDLWEEDENNDLQIVENDISIVAIDDTAMDGTLTAGLKYLARRSQNFGTDNNPFYFYRIQPTRVE